MIPTLEQAVLIELVAAGDGRPVPRELRLLAKDRTERARAALAHVDNTRPLGSFRLTVARRIAATVLEEHEAGIKVRSS